MSPDSPEARIGRLEQHVARLEQRVEDLSTDVRALMPLVIAHAEMKVVMDHMQSQLLAAIGEAQAARKDLGELREALEQRADDQRKERKSDRRWLIGTVLAASTLIISAMGILVGYAG